VVEGARESRLSRAHSCGAFDRVEKNDRDRNLRDVVPVRELIGIEN
jgi:hypothetical protein